MQQPNSLHSAWPSSIRPVSPSGSHPAAMNVFN